MEKTFGELEWEVLSILWDKESAKVIDIRNVILEKREIAYTTVLTVLQNLSKKGAVSFKKEQKSNVYFPAIKQSEVQSSFLGKLKNSLFKGSSLDLVQCLVNEGEVSEKDLTEIKEMIQKLGEKND